MDIKRMLDPIRKSFAKRPFGTFLTKKLIFFAYCYFPFVYPPVYSSLFYGFKSCGSDDHSAVTHPGCYQINSPA